MNLANFKSRATVKEHNTNNGWGFGGTMGKVYNLGDMCFRDLKFCYRHTGTSDAKSYWIGSKEVSKTDFEKTLSELV